MIIISFLILILLLSIYFIKKIVRKEIQKEVSNTLTEQKVKSVKSENNKHQTKKQILSKHPRNLSGSGLIISIIIIVSCFIFARSLENNEKQIEKDVWTHPFEKDQRKLIRNSTGNASCLYEVEKSIESINGYHIGIEHKGEGKFMAYVASPTTNYEYKVVHFYTNSNCEIINVVTL